VRISDLDKMSADNRVSDGQRGRYRQHRILFSQSQIEWATESIAGYRGLCTTQNM